MNEIIDFIAPGKNREQTKMTYEKIQKNVRLHLAMKQIEERERRSAIEKRIRHQKSIDDAQDASKRTTKLY